MSHSTGLCHLTSATAFTYETGVCHEEGLDSSCTQRVTNQEYDELSSASQKSEVRGVKSWLGTRGGREGGERTTNRFDINKPKRSGKSQSRDDEYG